MKSLPSYNDNRQYYKDIIDQINTKSNFPMYLNQLGYKLVKKSAGSMEFHNKQDKIVLNTSRNPVSYFNRNDSTDKGLFFKYVLKRKENFYKAVEAGLEIIRHIPMESTEFKVQQTEKSTFVPLEENYNIVPLQNLNFLVGNRGILETTLLGDKFKGRLFNAFHVRDNNGKIPNTAFPKYDLEGNIRNYVLYNRPFRSKVDGKIRKFRLVLNKKDQFLFHSQPVSGKKISLVVGESGMDILAYHQLYGKQENFYVSFSGNLYREKLEIFISLFKKHTESKKYEVISIMDNDRQGFEFDLSVFASLLNVTNQKVYLERNIIKGNVSMNFHYKESERLNISKDHLSIKSSLKKNLTNESLEKSKIKVLAFLDKLVIEFKLADLTQPKMEEPTLMFKELMGILTERFLSFPFHIDKSNEKDWNDELLKTGRPRVLELLYRKKADVTVGDVIGLKTDKGPEGAANKGIVLKIRENSVLCDFGLQYSYAIPYSNIRYVYKSFQHDMDGKINTKKKSKNNNLQNNIA